MDKYINEFSSHIEIGMELGNKLPPGKPSAPINNVLITGLGGSGISGTIVSLLVRDHAEMPFTINKDYTIPKFVSANTLVIVCSYNGCTEETLMALKQAEAQGAQIACITSGGKLQEIAEAKGYFSSIIPAGYPPRAAFGLGFTQILYTLERYGIIEDFFSDQLQAAAKYLTDNSDSIKQKGKELGEALYGKLPIIYAASCYEGVAIRFRQQINENAKQLCWHNVIPEMNHNELVGWRTQDDNFAVIILRNDDDFERTTASMKINKEIISNYTSNIYEVHSIGNSPIERSLYLINLCDWATYYLAECKKMDSIEVNVIDYLKDELAKL